MNHTSSFNIFFSAGVNRTPCTLSFKILIFHWRHKLNYAHISIISQYDIILLYSG